MRELDTESPVVWPAWCYTGEVSGAESTTGQRGESAELASSASSAHLRPSSHHLLGQQHQHHQQGAAPGGATLAANTAAALDARGASPQGAATTTHLVASAAATPRQPRVRRRQQNHNGIDASQVKTERLTPDNNSTSSRSVTPSSSGHPGTPPNATSLTGPDNPTGGAPTPHHLKHMETMMNRNYSDFMRSLAAKYQSNPTDYYSGSRNGYPAGLDPRFPGFKASAATPFVGLMSPALGAAAAAAAAAAGPQPPQIPTGAASSALSAKEPKEPKAQPAVDSTAATAANIFGASPATNLFPPMLDMSSTQALLHMVRTANAAQQSAAELESYLKGANKREPSLSSPLDLSSPSSVVPRKRARTTARPDSVSPKPSKLAALSISGATIPSPTGGLQVATPLAAAAAHTPAHPVAAMQTSSSSTSPTVGMSATPRPGSPPPVRCPSLCGHMPCGDGQAVNRWTVDDVVNYVSSIDICAEYAQNFREHRIDGSSLPLLSEEHLTGPIGMKLGPAIKLRVLLARKLGACTVCLHCAHCHQTPLPSALSAAAAVAAAAQAAAQAQQQQQTTPGRRSSAASNAN